MPDNFRLETGVRQGDLLSPCLLVPAAEVLAVPTGQNWNIRGISIGNKEIKLLQYADNTTAVLADEYSASAFLSLLDYLLDISGLKINCTKTEAMWIGSSRKNESKTFGLKLTSEPIKALVCLYLQSMVPSWEKLHRETRQY